MIVPVNFHRQSYRPDRFRGTTTQEVNFDELSYIHLFLNKLILGNVQEAIWRQSQVTG